MAFDESTIKRVFDSTGGCCHLCHRPVALRNYGTLKRRGAWEMDHSVPHARGGTDRLNNLKPAHVSCNRSKQARTTRSARARHGRTRAPLSFQATEKEREKAAVGMSVLLGVTGLAFGPVGALVGILAGLLLVSNQNPETE